MSSPVIEGRRADSVRRREWAFKALSDSGQAGERGRPDRLPPVRQPEYRLSELLGDQASTESGPGAAADVHSRIAARRPLQLSGRPRTHRRKRHREPRHDPGRPRSWRHPLASPVRADRRSGSVRLHGHLRCRPGPGVLSPAHGAEQPDPVDVAVAEPQLPAPGSLPAGRRDLPISPAVPVRGSSGTGFLLEGTHLDPAAQRPRGLLGPFDRDVVVLGLDDPEATEVRIGLDERARGRRDRRRPGRPSANAHAATGVT